MLLYVESVSQVKLITWMSYGGSRMFPMVAAGTEEADLTWPDSEVYQGFTPRGQHINQCKTVLCTLPSFPLLLSTLLSFSPPIYPQCNFCTCHLVANCSQWRSQIAHKLVTSQRTEGYERGMHTVVVVLKYRQGKQCKHQENCHSCPPPLLPLLPVYLYLICNEDHMRINMW